MQPTVVCGIFTTPAQFLDAVCSLSWTVPKRPDLTWNQDCAVLDCAVQLSWIWLSWTWIFQDQDCAVLDLGQIALILQDPGQFYPGIVAQLVVVPLYIVVENRETRCILWFFG